MRSATFHIKNRLLDFGDDRRGSWEGTRMQFESRALSDLFYERLRAIRSFPKTGIGDASPADLILPVLRLAESVLRERFGDKHYEISIWTTPETPQIIAYYNSPRQ